MYAKLSARKFQQNFSVRNIQQEMNEKVIQFTKFQGTKEAVFEKIKTISLYFVKFIKIILSIVLKFLSLMKANLRNLDQTEKQYLKKC